MNLEFKQIACYFPYELKIMQYRDDLKLSFESNLISLSNDTLGVTSPRFPFSEKIQYHEAKLILRPLSDLTKRIDKDEDVTFLAWIESEYETSVLAFIDVYGIERLPYEIMEYLFEWHFDVFGLREKDLCVYYDELVALKQE